MCVGAPILAISTDYEPCLELVLNPSLSVATGREFLSVINRGITLTWRSPEVE